MTINKIKIIRGIFAVLALSVYTASIYKMGQKDILGVNKVEISENTRNYASNISQKKQNENLGPKFSDIEDYTVKNLSLNFEYDDKPLTGSVRSGECTQLQQSGEKIENVLRYNVVICWEYQSFITLKADIEQRVANTGTDTKNTGIKTETHISVEDVKNNILILEKR